LHTAFLEDLVATLKPGAFTLEMRWAPIDGVHPPDLGLPSALQQGLDLGERLYQGLIDAAESFDFVAAVGSDHPELTADRVERAFAALETGAGAVLGPAEDGGYYLIALRSEAVSRRWFEGIPWSSDSTLATTVRRFRTAGLKPTLLPKGHDVDTPDDLAALAARLVGAGRGCPRTRGLLREWGRLE
jgi:glycosyltransferase A (GT-A) superfamily protein (DUF2064 family)